MSCPREGERELGWCWGVSSPCLQEEEGGGWGRVLLGFLSQTALRPGAPLSVSQKAGGAGRGLSPGTFLEFQACLLAFPAPG